MKKIFYIFVFFFPIMGFAQQSWYKSSPLDYMWKNVGNIGFTTGWATYTSLAFSFSDGQPYVAYTDNTNSNKANLMKFDGNEWVNVGDSNFSAGSWAAYTSLAFSPKDGQPYVAYEDCCYGVDSGKATVMKFDGINWINVGNAGFSIGNEVDYINLAFSPLDSLPYVAFSSWWYWFKATVMKFNGTNWVNVGNAGFSTAEADWVCFAFSPSGEPYVAYKDWALINNYVSYKATVMKFDGTSWVNVGNARFSDGEADNLSIAFSPSGQPYVAYADDGNSEKATVMKFDGSNWVNVGNAGFTPHGVYTTSIAFSPTGEPYIAYEDWTYTGKAIVMKFDGTNWVYVGSPTGFSAGNTDFTSLAFSPFGQPYVAYMDYANSAKATVMRYDSVFAGINEPKESTFSLYPNPAFTQLTIETLQTQTQSQLSIMNLNGQQLITRQLTESKTQIDISNLPSGVYFVRLTGERMVEIGKIIKQ